MNKRMYFLLGIFIGLASILQAQTYGEYGIIEWSESAILSVTDYITGDGTKPLRLGGNSSTCSITNNNDVCIEDRIEVNGIAAFDSQSQFGGDARVLDNVKLNIGTTRGVDGGFWHYTTPTIDTMYMWPGEESNYVVFCSEDDRAVDIGLAQQANPTLVIASQSIDSDQTERGLLWHDGTRFNIDSDNGPINFVVAVTTQSTVSHVDNVYSVYGSGGANIDGSITHSVDETVDSLVIHTGTDSKRLILRSAADRTVNTTLAAASDPTLTIMSDTFESDVTEYLSLYHDGSNGYINVGKGYVVFLDSVQFSGSAIVPSSLGIYFGGSAGSSSAVLRADNTADQFVLSLDDSQGRQLVITNSDNIIKDHDHADAGYPVVYIHSDEDPDVDNTEYGSLAHDGTDFVIDTGKGFIEHKDGLKQPFQNVAAATGTVNTTDQIIGVSYTATGVCTVTIDSDNTTAGRTITIKDTGGSAGSNNITIATEGAETIDGAATATISTNYGSVDIFSDGTNYFIK